MFTYLKILAGILLISATVVHALIAIELWASRHPESYTVSQRLMYRYMPEEGWILFFALCSISALLGLFHIRWVQLHFLVAGLLMLSWSFVALSIPGSIIISIGGVLLLHMAILKFACAYFAPKISESQRATAQLVEEIAIVEEQSSSKDKKEEEVRIKQEGVHPPLTLRGRAT